MLITILDLEREPVVFENLAFGPGAIEYGPELTQDLAAAPFPGAPTSFPSIAATAKSSKTSAFRPPGRENSRSPARAALNRSAAALHGGFDLIFRPLGRRCRSPGAFHYRRRGRNRLLSEETVFCLRMCFGSRCFCPFPRRTLCKRDCKGLCPRCGHNLNTRLRL